MTTITGRDAAWAADVRTAIGRLGYDALTQEIAEHWRVIETHDALTVVLYGPYSAGKSSLLARLLIEAGTVLPRWLTISGDKETFAVNSIASAGLVYTDTPGLGAGDAMHEARADEALLAADALLLILPPQLITTGRDHVLSVAAGTFFTPFGAAPFPAGALLAVINGSDSLGPHPRHAPREFADAARRRAEELRGRLIPALGAAPAPPVHVISADPSQLLTDQDPDEPPLRPDDFHDSAPWDGVAALRSAIGVLTGRAAELRAATRIRYWSHEGARILHVAGDDLSGQTEALAEAHRRSGHINSLTAELDALSAAACQELRADLGEALTQLGEAAPGLASPDKLQDEASRRLLTTVRAWRARWDSRLHELVRRAQTQVTGTRNRPGSGPLHAYADDILTAAAADPPASPGPAGPLPIWLTGHIVADAVLHATQRHFLHHHAGNADDAQREVADFAAGRTAPGGEPERPPRSDPDDTAAAYPVDSGAPDPDDTAGQPYDTAGQPYDTGQQDTATDTGTMADGQPAAILAAGDLTPGAVQAAETLFFGSLPGLIEFGALLTVDRRSKKEAKRLAELRATIERTTEGLTGQWSADWLVLTAEARARILMLAPPASLISALTDRCDGLRADTAALEELLKHPPS
jgi:hypothetical protein